MSLARFVADARHRIERGVYERPADLRPHGTLSDSLGPGTVVAELKPVSPAQGVLLPGDPGPVLDDLVAGGAAALSILTDPDHFGGSLELLEEAHARGVPLLMKDFVLDVRQIDAAARHGCSAVLLIERILAPPQREMLVRHAHDRGLEVLLEVHSPGEWRRASSSAADIIGVNARDLGTLKLDSHAQLDLVQHIAATGRPVMALSGIACRQDRLEAEAAGACAVLVGTALMRHPQRALALRALQHPLVKVCGLTHPDDVAAAAQAGADLAGFVVMASTPRSVAVEDAARLAKEARKHGLRPVLVSPTPDLDALIEAARAVAPDLVQWHHTGSTANAAARLEGFGIGLLAAVGPADRVPSHGDGLLLDSAHGGSGQTHDWQRSRTICQQDRTRMTLIAGGLAADNVAEALRATGAWGADASSRLEASPGRKDPEAVRAFVAAARAASGTTSTGTALHAASSRDATSSQQTAPPDGRPVGAGGPHPEHTVDPPAGGAAKGRDPQGP